jgi:transposase InsO family protein
MSPIVEGFAYVAVILDAGSRRAVGYAISHSIDVRLTLAALNAAIERRRPVPGCVHHSDRGSQYAAQAYREALLRCDLVGSIGRRGNPYAKAESFIKTLKVKADGYLSPQQFEDRNPRPTVKTAARSLSAPRGPLQRSPKMVPTTWDDFTPSTRSLQSGSFRSRIICGQRSLAFHPKRDSVSQGWDRRLSSQIQIISSVSIICAG